MQTWSVDVLHDDELLASIRGPVLVSLHDVRVVEPDGDLAFARLVESLEPIFKKLNLVRIAKLDSNDSIAVEAILGDKEIPHRPGDRRAEPLKTGFNVDRFADFGCLFDARSMIAWLRLALARVGVLLEKAVKNAHRYRFTLAGSNRRLVCSSIPRSIHLVKLRSGLPQRNDSLVPTAKSNLLSHFIEPVRPTMSMALEVSDLRKAYAGHEALRGVSFGVRAGERIALLGPNGAGKTTLIRCISGRIEVSAGEIKLFGKKLGQPNAATQLGVVPQELAIYSDLSARENLECFARLHGLRGRKLHDRVDWALDWIGLEDRASDLTAKFSGGMKRRVNIACGVMHQPGLLLLDEPTVGVDPQSRQRIFDMLDELNRLGTTILLTTHHLDEAQERSDRIVIIDHGQVIAEGRIEQLLEQTVGKQKRVSLEVETEGTIGKLPPGLSVHNPSGRIIGACENLADELPAWMQGLASSGIRIKNLELQTPNLHHVFLHLTGRELRE